VADEIISKEGLAHFSIAEVAHRAEISRQLVYQHFADLSVLLIEVMRVRLSELEISLHLPDLNRTLEIREVVEVQLRRILNLPSRDRQLMRGVFGNVSALHKDLWPIIADLRQEVVSRWAEIIDPQATPTPLGVAKMGLIIYCVMGSWDLMIDGSLSEDEAVGLLFKIIESFFVLPW
jgi:AcrR family transcriptional regulator